MDSNMDSNSGESKDKPKTVTGGVSSSFNKEGISNIKEQEQLNKIEEDYLKRLKIIQKRKATKSLQQQLRKNSIKKHKDRERSTLEKNQFNKLNVHEKKYYTAFLDAVGLEEKKEEDEVKEFELLKKQSVDSSEKNDEDIKNDISNVKPTIKNKTKKKKVIRI